MTKLWQKRSVAALILVSMLLALCTLSLSAAYDPLESLGSALDSIDTALTLTEKEEYLIAATEHLGAYTEGGGEITEGEVKALYDRYLAYKSEIDEKVGYCTRFMEYVDFAVYGEGGFTETVELLDAAEALLDKIDESYIGIAGAKADYTNLRAELYAPIEVCKSYIAFARAAAEAKNYGEAAENYNKAITFRARITIEDYPGLDEAEQDLKAADEFMSQRLQAAQNFIIAVKSISKAESVPLGIKEAYEIFERDNVDETAEGASSAMSELRMLEATYDRNVKRANGDVDEAMQLMLWFIF